jgi:hypothetical protein
MHFWNRDIAAADRSDARVRIASNGHDADLDDRRVVRNQHEIRIALLNIDVVEIDGAAGGVFDRQNVVENSMPHEMASSSLCPIMSNAPARRSERKLSSNRAAVIDPRDSTKPSGDSSWPWSNGTMPSRMRERSIVPRIRNAAQFGYDGSAPVSKTASATICDMTIAPAFQ